MGRVIAGFLPWVCALVWLGIRWVAGFSADFDFEKGRNAGVLANLFFILVVIFYTLVYRFRHHLSLPDFFGEMRKAAIPGLKYTIGVALMITLYYSVISDELPVKRAADMAINATLIDTDEELARIKEENIQLKTLNREQLLRAANERTALMTSEGFIIGTSLAGLTLTVVLYSMLGTFIFRQFQRAG